METVDLLVHARWIIPVTPEQIVHEHYSIAVKQGRIVALLPSREAKIRFAAADVVDLPHHVVIPGLVNSHTHVAMSLFRGLADDLPLMTWLNEHIWPAEAKWVNYEFVRDGTELGVAEMLRGGITCFSDMYFFPDETARVAATAGLRATVGMILIDFPTVWAQSPDEYIHKGIELHDQYRDHPLIRTAFAPHAPYTVSNGPLERVRVLADEMDVPIHMHVHETADEIHNATSQHKQRPLARLHDLGLLSPRLLAVHMTQLTDTEIAQLAETGTHVIHCPESNLKLASGLCPVAQLWNAGINVALGTDGNASNNDLDLFGEMRTAALLAKVQAKDASALPAHNALRMATINGAKALGLDNEIGSLEAGKSADFVAVDFSQLETSPVYHPLSHLVYAVSRHQVSDVWVKGQALLRQRRLTTLDEQSIIQRATLWRERIMEYS